MIDLDQAKARLEEIRLQQQELSDEQSDLMYRIRRADDAPLVGRFFVRNSLDGASAEQVAASGRDPDGWRVWTRVDTFDDEAGARGIEVRMAGGDWYDVKFRGFALRRDEVGMEITADEFYAAIAPVLERLRRRA
jgi:hypothetical protein